MLKRPWMLALLAIGCASSPIAATRAAEPGLYECSIRKSVGVRPGTGATAPLTPAPDRFMLEIGEGPIFGDQLRDTPTRRTDVYEPEGTPVMVARIDAPLFSKRADRLVSRDRRSFSDGATSIVLNEDGSFAAFGEAPSAAFAGVAIYSGYCVTAR